MLFSICESVGDSVSPLVSQLETLFPLPDPPPRSLRSLGREAECACGQAVVDKARCLRFD